MIRLIKLTLPEVSDFLNQWCDWICDMSYLLDGVGVNIFLTRDKAKVSNLDHGEWLA